MESEDLLRPMRTTESRDSWGRVLGAHIAGTWPLSVADDIYIYMNNKSIAVS